MAAISITAANVLTVSGTTEWGTAGATVTAGQTVYKKASDSKFYLADCDKTAHDGNAEIDNVYGIALNAASASQPLCVQKTGTITIGGTVTVGTIYTQSATAGGIAPWSELTTNDQVVIIGVGTTAAIITLNILTTGVAIPA